MSSPSASSSSHSHQDGDSQSTKDRRRERNRLAAQKHRLRRTQRMSQLEEQVLALQQEKHALITQLDPRDCPAWSDQGPQRKRPRTLSRLPDVDDKPDQHVARLEDRIIELERWVEELNGSLQDAADSELQLQSELKAQALQADTQARQYRDAIHTYDAEMSSRQAEIDVLRKQLSKRSEDNGYARHSLHNLEDELQTHQALVKELRLNNTELRETADSCEVTLELQRRENERLRTQLKALTAQTDTDAKTSNNNIRASEEQLRKVQAHLENVTTEWEKKLETLEEENRRLTESLSTESRAARQLSSARSKLTRLESENGRLKEMMESYEHKVELLEESARAKEGHRGVEEANANLRLRSAEDSGVHEAQEPDDALGHADADANAREEHWREKWEETESEKNRLSDKVTSLHTALEKVGAFLASKGIPIDMD